MSKLFFVSGKGWGHNFNIVRAPNAEAAVAFIGCAASEVEELREGDGILWSYEDSPDTGDRD